MNANAKDMEERTLINQARYEILRREAVRERRDSRKRPSAHKHGVAGALLAATSFGAFFPIVLGAAGAAATGVDTLVLVATGALFGIITGGTMGYSIGHRGR